MPAPKRRPGRPRVTSGALADGQPCHCGRATAPDLREQLPDGRTLVHGAHRCAVRPGRPSAAGGTRSTAVLVRLQPEELERLREAAQRAGLGIGPWLRSLGMREAHKETT